MTVDRLNAGLRALPTWPVYLAGAALPVWLFWLGTTGGLGVEPINALERRLGEAALQMLVATLAVTPLRRFTGLSLLRFRRAMGLVAFFWVCCHLLVWLALDVGALDRIVADILKRPYVTVGMAGFLLLVPLALTSTDRAIRRLGPRTWRRLHRLSYAAAILGAIHFAMLVKGFQLEPLVYLGVLAALLAARLDLPRRAARPDG